MRFRSAFLVVATAISAGCGGAEGPSSEEGAAPPPGAIEALWRAPGEDVGLIQGTSDYSPGRNRVSFLVIRGNGQVVERPRARVWLATAKQAKPFLRTTAALAPIGVPGGAESDTDVKNLYVTSLKVGEPGTYWLLAEPVGGRPIQALGNLVVKPKAATPAIGKRAIASNTPTLETTHGNLKLLSTSSKPVPALYRYSIAESLAARKPFVVTFATPKFCQSRTCGPTVDVVDRVRRSTPGDVRFIHVEIYWGNDPSRGVNRWVKEWKLPTEPWVFVVGRDGLIKAKFEGSVSVPELTTALARLS